MRNWMLRLASAVAVTAAVATVAAQTTPAPPPAIPRPLVPNAAPARACDALRTLTLPDTTIESAAEDAGNANVPASCRITAIVTHPPAGDRVTIWIALPMTNWNGRFQGVG